MELVFLPAGLYLWFLKDCLPAGDWRVCVYL
jgi:hypothetical protein